MAKRGCPSGCVKSKAAKVHKAPKAKPMSFGTAPAQVAKARANFVKVAEVARQTKSCELAKSAAVNFVTQFRKVVNHLPVEKRAAFERRQIKTAENVYKDAVKICQAREYRDAVNPVRERFGMRPLAGVRRAR